MFLISGPQLVIAACRAGVVGAFPSLNARTVPILQDWLSEISGALSDNDAPWAVNLIVHRSNARMEEDLELIVRHRAPIVITALSTPGVVIERIHAYGGLVFADVNSVEYARKAAAAGVDGLVLVAAGAGGHTGMISPFTFVPAVRRFFPGMIAVGGGIVDGRGVAAVEALGADFAYLGTRFIATRESLAADGYKQALIQSDVRDIVPSAHFTGITANYLRSSIVQAGLDPATLERGATINVDNEEMRGKAWKDIWSAGHGVFAVEEVHPVADLVDHLAAQYRTGSMPNENTNPAAT